MYLSSLRIKLKVKKRSRGLEFDLSLDHSSLEEKKNKFSSYHIDCIFLNIPPSSLYGAHGAFCRSYWQRRCVFFGVQYDIISPKHEFVFWERRVLLTIAATHSNRVIPVIRSKFSMVAQLLCVASMAPTTIS